MKTRIAVAVLAGTLAVPFAAQADQESGNPDLDMMRMAFQWQSPWLSPTHAAGAWTADRNGRWVVTPQSARWAYPRDVPAAVGGAQPSGPASIGSSWIYPSEPYRFEPAQGNIR